MPDTPDARQDHEAILSKAKAYARQLGYVPSSEVEDIAAEAVTRLLVQGHDGALFGIVRNIAREWCRKKALGRKARAEVLAKAKKLFAALGPAVSEIASAFA